MTNSLMVMTVGENGTLERILQRNIDMAFVCEDIVIIFPI